MRSRNLTCVDIHATLGAWNSYCIQIHVFEDLVHDEQDGDADAFDGGELDMK